MELADTYREYVLNVVVQDFPVTFWRRLGERSRFMYGEAFSIVDTDSSLLEEQKPHKLYQERYFKMEHVLIAVANAVGVPASAKLIGTNLCRYAYAARRRLGVTQSYVQVSGEMPTPAAFRTQLAEMAAFKRSSRLDLGDEPTELILPKQVNGIILHSPVGRKFTEEEQKLGALGLFVAHDDFSGWAVDLPLPEILSAYKPAEKREDRATPARRKITKTGTDE